MYTSRRIRHIIRAILRDGLTPAQAAKQRLLREQYRAAGETETRAARLANIDALCDALKELRDKDNTQ